MAVVSLLTDFGAEDAYVGMVKAVILSVDPRAVIVDITHAVGPGDVMHAAYLLKTAFAYFPEGAIHVVVVDPGVGGDRAIVALEMAGHCFLAPDNGVLGPLMESTAPERVVRVENQRFFRQPVSRTFHGRDIFAPVAGHLSLGLDLSALGPRCRCEHMVRLAFPSCRFVDARTLVGKILFRDRFGNLITNIGEKEIVSVCEGRACGGLTVTLAGRAVHGLSDHYAAVPSGAPLALIGSTGQLELSVNGGDAGLFFQAGVGETVQVTCRS